MSNCYETDGWAMGQACQREIADLRAKLKQAQTVQYITPEACEHLCPTSARARRLEEAIDKARRETASDPDNRWCRNATIILRAALADEPPAR